MPEEISEVERERYSAHVAVLTGMRNRAEELISKKINITKGLKIKTKVVLGGKIEQLIRTNSWPVLKKNKNWQWLLKEAEKLDGLGYHLKIIQKNKKK